MSITLDGQTYYTFQTGYAHAQTKIGVTDRGLTGLPIRVESGFFDNTFTIDLLIDVNDLVNLRASLNKTDPTGTPPNNLLSFTDEEGVSWIPSAGSDDSTHIYSTGVYFTNMTPPKPLSVALGFSSGQRLTTTLTLIVNASGLRSA